MHATRLSFESQATAPSRILIVNGSGFRGWPTALSLSAAGYEIAIVDHSMLYAADIDSLTPIAPLDRRLRAWHERTSRKLTFALCNSDQGYRDLVDRVRAFQPETILYFAEYPGDPLDRDLDTTYDLLIALAEARIKTHLIYIDRIDRMARNQSVFAFYDSKDNTRITALFHDIVWGTQTDQTRLDPRLINRFDYQRETADWFNRWLIQGAIGHPMTVNGFGDQQRAFVHIQDMIRSIEHTIANPPTKNQPVRIVDQTTETHRVRDLAQRIARLTGTPIAYLDKQRPTGYNDNDSRYLALDPSFKAHSPSMTLDNGLAAEVSDIVRHYLDRVDLHEVVDRSLWRYPPGPIERGRHAPRSHRLRETPNLNRIVRRYSNHDGKLIDRLRQSARRTLFRRRWPHAQ